MKYKLCKTCLVLLFISNYLFTQINYNQQIQPIFNNHCLTCHVSVNGSGALELDSYEYLMQGDSNNGPVVMPFNADSSLLYRVLLPFPVEVPNEPICCRMPKNGEPLSIDQINMIYDWINEGAQENYLPIEFGSSNPYSGRPIIKAYPNPFNNEITIELIINNKSEFSAGVYNSNGQLIKRFSIDEYSNSHKFNWQLSNSKTASLSSGIYFINVKNTEVSKNFKILYLK